MNISNTTSTDKPEDLLVTAEQLQKFVEQAAQDGMALYDTEKSVLATVLRMGFLAIDEFLKLQGNGDLGQTIQTEDGQTLLRSEQPKDRPLRTIFGEHTITAYVYSPGPKKKIAFRPIDARLNLPAGKGSYLWEEFSQYFCVEQAFAQSAHAMETVFGHRLSVDTLERTNQRIGHEAGQFLDSLPVPPVEEEGELLVATADGKGVPLIRKQVEATPVHGPKPARPNNRRMATVASVYSVDRYHRTPEDVVAALFRDERPESDQKASRPKPCHKRMTACFPTLEDEGTEDELEIRGDMHAWTWVAGQIETRRREDQVLIRLCDGQPSLWTSSDVCLGLDVQKEDQPDDALEAAPVVGDTLKEVRVVDILDILHVLSYIWSAGRAFFSKDDVAVERFARQRLQRILEGEVTGVIKGLRSMASRRNLRGERLQDVNKACNYFENNVDRMRYSEYLEAGYPIASGVIEGACRHLVKDRMERTGMRWQQPSAGSMLFVRALSVTDLWDDFQTHRQAAQQVILHPNRTLIENYAPTFSLAV